MVGETYNGVVVLSQRCSGCGSEDHLRVEGTTESGTTLTVAEECGQDSVVSRTAVYLNDTVIGAVVQSESCKGCGADDHVRVSGFVAGIPVFLSEECPPAA